MSAPLSLPADAAGPLAPWLAGAVLGLSAAVHCLGMCGPLVIALGKTKSSWGGLLVYHLSRTASYLVLGVLVLSVAPMASGQRWLSVVSGLLLLATAWQEQFAEPACCTTQKTPWHRRLLQWRMWSLKNTSGVLTSSVLGGLNGLLPCGMVYAAIASSSAFGGWSGGIPFLVGFGTATAVPLIALQAAGKHLPAVWMARWKRASAVLAVGMGLWFIARGAGWGIPLLSPTEKSLHVETHLPAAENGGSPCMHPNGPSSTDNPEAVYPIKPKAKSSINPVAASSERPGACCTH